MPQDERAVTSGTHQWVQTYSRKTMTDKPKYAATGSYKFHYDSGDPVGCSHTDICLRNSDEEGVYIQCGICLTSWKLVTPLYGPPPIIKMQICGRCNKPVEMIVADCPMHELRIAAVESVFGDGEDRLVNAALLHTADCFRATLVTTAKDNVLRPALMVALKLLERITKAAN